jgi:hypothetical protein
LDSIDEIEAKNNRNLETAELVSAYMRNNAKRAAQKAAQDKERRPAEASQETDYPQESDGDKLDFSSEFSAGDMGLAQHGGSAELLAWKRQIEDEEDERRHQEPEDQEQEQEDQEQAEEWREGGWQEQQADEDQEPVEGSPDEPDDGAPIFPKATPLFLRPGQHRTPAAAQPSPTTSPPPLAPALNQTAAGQPSRPSPSLDDVLGTEAAQRFWSDKPDTVEPSSPVAPSPVCSPLPAFLERRRPEPLSVLPPSGQLAQVPPALAQLARNLIMNSPLEAGYEECVRLLSRFGAGALRMCSKAKVKLEILDESGFTGHSALTALGLAAEQTPCDGAYVVQQRLVLVDRRCLVSKPRFFHPALYYFAHAFDHAQGGETFSSRKAAAVVACFEASTRAPHGFDFIDELAAADPVRYFARSVAVYLGRDDCAEPLWTHQDLHDFDRAMYDYLQYLFARLES